MPLPVPIEARVATDPRKSDVRRYRGGCQCGAVHYEAMLDLGLPSACGQSVWEQQVEPAGFTLLIGDESLAGYQFFAESVHHFFCVRCGVRVFCHHLVDAADFYTIDLRTLHSQRAPGVGWQRVASARSEHSGTGTPSG